MSTPFSVMTYEQQKHSGEGNGRAQLEESSDMALELTSCEPAEGSGTRRLERSLHLIDAQLRLGSGGSKHEDPRRGARLAHGRQRFPATPQSLDAPARPIAGGTDQKAAHETWWNRARGAECALKFWRSLGGDRRFEDREDHRKVSTLNHAMP
jgi:hypothetical protein